MDAMDLPSMDSSPEHSGQEDDDDEGVAS